MKAMYKKLASVLLALVMVLSLLPMAAFAAEGDAYDTLVEAVNHAPKDGTQTTITLTGDIEAMTSEQIITIQEGQNIVLNMDGHHIYVDADFTGRPIVNNGTLTVTGNGIIDSSASESGGYGAINNTGTLTIKNGTYRGATYASGSAIRNTGRAAVLTIDNGTFERATCAVYNEGSATINDGSFTGTTCSRCNNQIWSYTLRNNGEGAVMTINGGSVSGIQGAVGISAGHAEINGGNFKTVACDTHGTAATFYALYVAGEVEGVKCVVNNGTFETEGTQTAVLIGNDNTNGDGGINADAAAELKGGTYIAPAGVPAIKGAPKTGDPIITGGTYSSDISQYVAEGYGTTFENNQYIVSQSLNGDMIDIIAQAGNNYYKTLEAAVAAAARGDTVTLLKDVALSDSLQIDADDVFTLDLNGHTLSNAAANTIVSAGNLTITDSKTTGSVTSGKAAVRVTDGSTTIQAGAYTGEYGVVSTGTGIANISGGTLTGSVAAVQAQIGGTVNVSGGTLTSANIAVVCINQPGSAKTTVHITGGHIVGTGDSGFGVVAQGTTATENREKAEAVVTIGGTADITGDVGVFMKGYGAEVNVEGGSITSSSYAISGNGTVKDGDDQGDTVLNITGGTIKQVGSDGGSAIYHPQDGVLNISGDAVIEGETGIQLCSGEGVIGSITGGSITATGADRRASKTGDGLIPDGAALSIVNRNYPGGTPKMDVSGGRFASHQSQAVLAYTWSNNTASGWPEASQYLTVTGGYYTSDVREFVTDSALASIAGTYIFDGTTYAYQVAAKLPDKVEIVESQPVVNMDNLPEEQQEALKETVSKITGTGLTEKAHEVTVNQQVDLPADTEKVDVYNANLPEGATIATEASAVTLVVAPRLDIQVEAFSDVEGEKSLKLDIKAVYDIKATTAADGEMKEWDGEGDVTAVNTVTVEKNAGTLDTVGTEIEISIPLPAGFVTDETTPVYIHHIKNGQTYVYKATVENSGNGVYTATFTNPHGFSTFIVKTEAAASIEAAGQTNYYATLQDAVDAVANGQTITVLKNGETATVGRTVRFTVQTDTGVTGYTITPGVNCTNQSEVEGEYDIVYHAPVIGGGESGDEPCDGGKDCPAGKFTDVDTGLWYHEAIDYVLTHGMMQGTGETAFAPNATLTRAMLAQVLYNLEGKPAAGAAVFTDVPASAWYADAVNWAAAQKIVEGYGDGTFGPEAPVTRQQMAAILYRYAAYKAYDVSAKGELSAFTDGGQTAAWAEAAVEWAVGAKLLAGKGNGTLDPTGTATRAQVAQLLMNFCEQIAK